MPSSSLSQELLQSRGLGGGGVAAGRRDAGRVWEEQPGHPLCELPGRPTDLGFQLPGCGASWGRGTASRRRGTDTLAGPAAAPREPWQGDQWLISLPLNTCSGKWVPGRQPRTLLVPFLACSPCLDPRHRAWLEQTANPCLCARPSLHSPCGAARGFPGRTWSQHAADGESPGS